MKNHLANRSKIYSIEDLEAHHYAKKNGTWFDVPEMRYFKSRLSSALFYGTDTIFFISSERFDDNTPRAYSVRSYRPATGEIDTVGEFQGFPTLSRAKAEATREANKELVS